MRVLHILSGDLWGGAEAQMGLQLAALSGIEVEVLLFNEGEPKKRYEAAGISCRVVSESQGFLSLYRLALAEVSRSSPNVVIAHGYKESLLGALLSWRLGIPLVTWFHGWSENYSGWKNLKMKLYGAIYLAIARYKAARVVTVTRALGKELGLEGKKLRVIHNVASVSESAVHGEKLIRDSHQIICVGRLAPVKRLDRAIEIVRRMNANKAGLATLHLVGDGPEREALTELAASLGESVKFLGFQRDVSSFLMQADVLLLTSDSEGLPTVVLEALMVGTPVVASDLPGLREVKEVIPGEVIKLVDKNDIEGFVRAIINREQVSAEISALVREQFSAKRAAAQQVELVSTL